MESERLTLPDNNKTLFLRVADAIRDAITKGRFNPGDRLPSSRDLSAELGVHRHTVTAAMDQLISEGWVTGAARLGFIVNRTVGSSSEDKDPATEEKKAEPFRWHFHRKINLANFAADSRIKFNFQSGLPDLRLFPTEEFRQFIGETMKNHSLDLLNYSSPAGWPPLIEAVKEYIERIRNIRDRSIVITNGSGEAIFIAMQLLVGPGDVVALEELTYPPVRELVRSLGAKIISIRMTESGLDLEDLRRKAQKYRIKLLFMTPTHHFPTTVSLSAGKKIALYDLLQEFEIPVIEDDYDHELHYDNHPPEPLAARDPAGRVIYVSTFSKTLFPSARIAFMVVPKSFAAEFCQYRRIVSHQNDSLLQDALARWIVSGGMERHIKRTRKIYQTRRDFMDGVLKEYLNAGASLKWRIPEGGMGIWLDVGQNAEQFAQSALERGVFVTPESYYRLNKQAGTHLRLGFANLNENEILAGLGSLLRAD